MNRRTAAVVAAISVISIAVFVLTDRFGSKRGADTRRERPAASSAEIAVAYPEEPLSMNPYTFAGDSNATRDLLRPMLPTLLSITPALRYTDGVAKVPVPKKMSDGKIEIVYSLNPKAVWSDGVPVTSADVRFTWETLRDPTFPAANRFAYGNVIDVAEVSPKKVKIVLDGTSAAWKDLFSGGDFILPKHLFAGKDLAAQMVDAVPLSAGPFILESWEPGLQMVLARNPRWWGRVAPVKKVRIVFVPDTETALHLLRKGEVQVVGSTSQPNLTARFKRIKGVSVRSRYGCAWWELGVNASRPALADTRVRSAVGFGIDRRGFVEAVMKGEARPLDTARPCQSKNNEYQALVKNHDELKGLLRQAGIPEKGGRFTLRSSEPVSLSVPSTGETSFLWQRAIQRNLRDAGVRIDIRSHRADEFYGQWRRDGFFDLALWERRGTPSMSLATHFRSNLHPPAGMNYTRATSGPLDGLLDTAGTDDAGFRAALDQLAKESAVIPLAEVKLYLASAAGVVGPDPNPTIDGPFWNLQRWAWQR